jgi:hypothetical protein
MQTLFFGLIVAVMTVGYVALTFHLPGVVKIAPEAIAILFVPYILAIGSRERFHFVQPKYWLVLLVLLFDIVAGLIINDVEVGPTMAGLRMYLRILPIFILPAVWHLEDGQLKRQLQLLLLFSLLQIPLSAIQRWTVWQQQRFSGDQVVGTLTESGVLSIFLVCVVVVLLGLVMRKVISKKAFTVLFFLLLIPTTINETKATVLLLPLGLFAVLLMGSRRGKRLPILAGALALLVCFGAIFIPVYNLMQTNNPYKKDITTFFTDKKQLETYLEAKKAGVGTTAQVGRVDALRIPVEYLASDPVRLTFGLGVGNSSQSSLGTLFSGKYATLFTKITITGFSTFMLEMGLLGTALVFLLYWMIFRDSIYVARHDTGLRGALAVGWTGVIPIMAASTFYTNVQVFESLAFLFWFFSGVICARRAELAMGEVRAPAETDTSVQLPRTPLHV